MRQTLWLMFDAMMGMKKIDVAAITAARRG
jgi:hypothetical protein